MPLPTLTTEADHHGCVPLSSKADAPASIAAIASSAPPPRCIEECSVDPSPLTKLPGGLPAAAPGSPP